MPTRKPRTSWLIEPELLEQLKTLAAKHRRPVAREAELALEEYVEKHRHELD